MDKSQPHEAKYKNIYLYISEILTFFLTIRLTFEPQNKMTLNDIKIANIKVLDK
jgi:hypothetical protein